MHPPQAHHRKTQTDSHSFGFIYLLQNAANVKVRKCKNKKKVQQLNLSPEKRHHWSELQVFDFSFGLFVTVFYGLQSCSLSVAAAAAAMLLF